MRDRISVERKKDVRQRVLDHVRRIDDRFAYRIDEGPESVREWTVAQLLI
jgi:hypothetical protein